MNKETKKTEENNNEKDYLNIIQNSPLDLFIEISEDKLNVWRSKLLENESFTKIKDDTEILMFPPKHELQDLIKKDCERTRKRESILLPGFKKILEIMLTYHCEKKKIKYKQSINEIFGPLLLMKYKIPKLKYYEIYNIAESFIGIYLQNYYIDPIDVNRETKEIINPNEINNENQYYIEKFFPVYPTLQLFILLLKYHEPAIFNILDKFNIDPKLYAMKWFLTGFTSHLKLNILYPFIDYLILVNDNLFLHYVFIALIKLNRNKIFEIDDKMKYLPVLSKLTISSIEELSLIMCHAIEIRESTPYSYRIFANKLKITKKNVSIEKLLYNYKKLSLEKIPSIPIFPMEIFFITYKENIKCPDEKCKINKKLKKKTNGGRKINENYICEHCDMIINKKITYILIDLRILEFGDFSDENEKTGFLPNMIMVDQEELRSEDFPEIISERFKPNRGSFHFIFLISENYDFTKLENFYENENNIDNQVEYLFSGNSAVEEKTEKKLNLKDAKFKLDKKQMFKLKEYDNFKLTLKSFLKENYPYVSFAYGGYSLIHKKSFNYNISLLDHDEKNCILCQSKNKKKNNLNSEINNNIEKLWEHKIKIKIDYINELSKVEENLISFCILVELNGKNLENERIQIIICLIFQDLKIEIYKNERKKIYEDNEINTTKQKFDSKYFDLGKENKENKQQELTLIGTLNFSQILQIFRDKQRRNIITIEYLDLDNLKKKVIIDFPSKDESKHFIKRFKNMSEQKH